MALIKRIREVQLPKYQTEGAAGFDLAAVNDTLILPGDIKYVPTGLVIQAPPGHFLMVAARSSLAKRHNLMMPNGVGIVDEDYCGDLDELQVPLWNFGKDDAWLRAGDRIAQGVFVQITREPFTEVTDPDTIAASRGGFGSTG